MSKGVIQFLLVVVGFVLLGMVFTNIYAYFGIAIILTAILRPITGFLKRFQFFGLRIPGFLAVLLGFASLASLTIAFILLFVPLISDQVKVMAQLDYEMVSERLGKPLIGVERFLFENDLTEEKEGFIMERIRDQFGLLVTKIDVGNIINYLISFTGTVFIGGMAVFFITFFFLYETGPIRRWFISLIPNKYFEVAIATFTKIEKLLSNYLLGLFLQMFAIFSLSAIGLSLIGVKYALLIALFAAVANIIPYLGPLIGSAFGVLVALTITPDISSTQDYFILVSKIVSVFAVVQITDNLLWQPLIFSKSVKAHPLEVFIVIFAGANIAGILGMIMAIPIYTVIRVCFVEYYLGSRKYRIFKIQKVNFK